MSHRLLKNTPTLYLIKSGHPAIDTALEQAVTELGVNVLTYEDLEESLSHIFHALQRQKVMALCYPTQHERDGYILLQFHLKTSMNSLSYRSMDPIKADTTAPLLPLTDNNLFTQAQSDSLVHTTTDIINRYWVKTAEYQFALAPLTA